MKYLKRIFIILPIVFIASTIELLALVILDKNTSLVDKSFLSILQKLGEYE